MSKSTSEATFWNDPPWANGEGGYKMGLLPVELERWCKHAITQHQLKEKIALLQTNYADVVQTTDASMAAQTLLAKHVGEIHNLDDANESLTQIDAAPEDRPLLTSALCVPDDLCLLQRHHDHYDLIAGCVTAPSYWRLRDKLGKAISVVHNNVPGLNDALGDRMHAFFERLPAERCLLRRNWFLHHTDAKFQPKPERRTNILTAAAAKTLTVRSETQTLRRLSDDVIVFTIAVECYPLSEIADYPTAARSMRSALASRNSSERLAASQDTYEQGVLAYLKLCV